MQKTWREHLTQNRCYPFLLWIISLSIYIILYFNKNINIFIENCFEIIRSYKLPSSSQILDKNNNYFFDFCFLRIQ